MKWCGTTTRFSCRSLQSREQKIGSVFFRLVLDVVSIACLSTVTSQGAFLCIMQNRGIRTWSQNTDIIEFVHRSWLRKRKAVTDSESSLWSRFNERGPARSISCNDVWPVRCWAAATSVLVALFIRFYIGVISCIDSALLLSVGSRFKKWFGASSWSDTTAWIPFWNHWQPFLFMLLTQGSFWTRVAACSVTTTRKTVAYSAEFTPTLRISSPSTIRWVFRYSKTPGTVTFFRLTTSTSNFEFLFFCPEIFFCPPVSRYCY